MSSQKFYFMSGEGKYPIAPIDDPEINLPRWSPWTNGEKIKDEISEPIIYTIDMSELDKSEEEREDMDILGLKPDDFNIPTLWEYAHPPLICQELADIIRSMENVQIELFKAEVHNPLSGKIHSNYYSFNLLKIAEFELARDIRSELNQREFRFPSEKYPIFYLYDDGPIVVNEELKNKIVAAKIEALYFIPSYEQF